MTLPNLEMTLTGLDAELADCSSEDLEGMIRFLADLEYQVRPERADFDWHSPTTPRRLSLMLYRARHTLATELKRREGEGGSSRGLGSVEDHWPPALQTMAGRRTAGLTSRGTDTHPDCTLAGNRRTAVEDRETFEISPMSRQSEGGKSVKSSNPTPIPDPQHPPLFFATG